jgi:hypothetical protein
MSEFEGVGFGVHGHEKSYIVLIDDDGDERIIFAHQMLPSDGRVSWPLYEALTGGFGDRCADVLARKRNIHDIPLAYRIRISVEVGPLTRAETEALLAKAKAKKAAE